MCAMWLNMAILIFSHIDFASHRIASECKHTHIHKYSKALQYICTFTWSHADDSEPTRKSILRMHSFGCTDMKHKSTSEDDALIACSRFMPSLFPRMLFWIHWKLASFVVSHQMWEFHTNNKTLWTKHTATHTDYRDAYDRMNMMFKAVTNRCVAYPHSLPRSPAYAVMHQW